MLNFSHKSYLNLIHHNVGHYRPQDTHTHSKMYTHTRTRTSVCVCVIFKDKQLILLRAQNGHFA